MTELLGRLGRQPDERLVIITADGLGASHAGNQAIATALVAQSGRQPLAMSASLQVPCPWARGGAEVAPLAAAVGIELTLNSAPSTYRWGSITHAPSLNDGAGALPATVEDLLEHADTPEILRECRAQIGRARQWGLEPAYLTSHLDALAYRPEFFDVLIELAIEFSLPIRLPDQSVDLGFDARRLANDEGVLTPDYTVQAPSGRDVREAASEALRNLRPGVTEIVTRPAADSAELRALTPSWAAEGGRRPPDHPRLGVPPACSINPMQRSPTGQSSLSVSEFTQIATQRDPCASECVMVYGDLHRWTPRSWPLATPIPDLLPPPD